MLDQKVRYSFSWPVHCLLRPWPTRTCRSPHRRCHLPYHYRNNIVNPIRPHTESNLEESFCFNDNERINSEWLSIVYLCDPEHIVFNNKGDSFSVLTKGKLIWNMSLHCGLFLFVKSMYFSYKYQRQHWLTTWVDINIQRTIKCLRWLYTCINSFSLKF